MEIKNRRRDWARLTDITMGSGRTAKVPWWSVVKRLSLKSLKVSSLQVKDAYMAGGLLWSHMTYDDFHPSTPGPSNADPLNSCSGRSVRRLFDRSLRSERAKIELQGKEAYRV